MIRLSLWNSLQIPHSKINSIPKPKSLSFVSNHPCSEPFGMSIVADFDIHFIQKEGREFGVDKPWQGLFEPFLKIIFWSDIFVGNFLTGGVNIIKTDLMMLQRLDGSQKVSSKVQPFVQWVNRPPGKLSILGKFLVPLISKGHDPITLQREFLVDNLTEMFSESHFTTS